MRNKIATAAAALGCGAVVWIARAIGGGPPVDVPEVPLTPIRLISPTPITSVVLPAADEPNGVYLMVVLVHPTVSPLPKPLSSRTPRP